MSVESPPRQQAGVALVLLCVSQFMLTLDATVVTVALPAMQHELGLAPAHLQWLSTAYTLLFGGFLILAGRAADLFGKRRMMVTGLVLFTVASLAAGLSQQTWDIIAARAVQGLGAAIVTPAALALLTTTFPEGPLRNKAMAYWGAVASAGAIGGYVLSGLIVDTIGWRWIFFVNIPIGVLSVLGVVKLFGADRPEKRTRLDLSGALTLTTAVVVIVYAMTTAGTGQFGAVELALLVGGFVLLGTFVWIEQRKPDPLVRFEILAGRSVLIGNVINVVNAATSMVILFFATLYLQEVLELTPLQAGLAFAPVTAVILVVSGRTAPLMAKFGPRPLLIAGSVASLAGVAWLTQISVDGSYLMDVFPGLIFVGVGAALTFAPSMIVATSGVADEYQGLSTGLVSTSQQLGGAVGLAVFATIIAGRITAAGGDEAALTDAYGFGYVWALSLPVLAIVATALVPRKAAAPQS